MNESPYTLDIAVGRWRLRWRLRPRASWRVRQQGQVQRFSKPQASGGLAAILRDGPSAYGYQGSCWTWTALEAFAQQHWGNSIDATVLQQRLKALGYHVAVTGEVVRQGASATGREPSSVTPYAERRTL